MRTRKSVANTSHYFHVMTNSSVFCCEFPRPAIAVIRIDDPNRTVNLLSRSVLEELSACLDDLQRQSELRSIILVSGKQDGFTAGADIRELRNKFDWPESRRIEAANYGKSVLKRLAELPLLTIAAIDGPCLGGGAELACWCDLRIATDGPRTEIGFPEVRLGLIPGWGGTVRLTRLIGIGNSLDLLLSGESVDGRAALNLGLVDRIVKSEELVDAAVAVADEVLESGDYVDQRRQREQPSPISATELEFLADAASAGISGRAAEQNPALQAVIDTVVCGSQQPLADACQSESEAVARLVGSPVNRGLSNVFLITAANRKDLATVAVHNPLSIERVGVVGAGIMGSGIAGANLRRGCDVRVFEVSEDALQAGIARAIQDASFDRRTRTIDPQRVSEYAARIGGVKEIGNLADRDLVVEAIVENEETKCKLLAELDRILPPRAILASNTSTYPISRLAMSLDAPHRFCGMHFFNPVKILKLVEVIRGQQTSDETIAAVAAHAQRLGKIPVIVNDGPGFLVNRLLMQYMNEALAMLAEGATLEAIDSAAEDFGMAMGPIGVFDLVGLDTALYAGKTMWQAFPDRVVLSPILGAMIRNGRLGRKSGAGFYQYAGGKKAPQSDPAAVELIATYVRRPRELDKDEIRLRLLLPMLLEAVRVLDDGVVQRPGDVDLGMIYGLGFPAFRGGLLHWSDEVGAAALVRHAMEFRHHGKRFEPPARLIEMARTGGRFYETTATED